MAGSGGVIKFAFSNRILGTVDTIKTSRFVYYVSHYYCYYIVVVIFPPGIRISDGLRPPTLRPARFATLAVDTRPSLVSVYGNFPNHHHPPPPILPRVIRIVIRPGASNGQRSPVPGRY